MTFQAFGHILNLGLRVRLRLIDCRKGRKFGRYMKMYKEM